MPAKVQKILIVIAMILILAVVAFMFYISRSKNSQLEEKLSLALEYCELMDYDKSIAIYNEIMQSNSSEPKVYIGLSDVYVKMGKDDKAVAILEKGLEKSGQNEKIKERLKDLTGENEEKYDLTEDEKTAEESIFDVSEDNTEPEVTEVTTIETTLTETSEEAETTVTSVSEKSSSVPKTVTVTVPGETVYVYITVPGTAAAETTAYTSKQTSVTTVSTENTTINTEPEINTSLSGTVRERSISINNLSNYVLTKDYVNELGIYDNTLIKIKSYYVTLYLNSSVFNKCDSIDLSLSVNNNTGKSVVNFKNEADFGCEIKVVVTSNTIGPEDLKGAHLYRNSSDIGVVSVNSDGYPEFTVSQGGKYTILPYEEEEKTTVAIDDGTRTLSVNNLNEYTITRNDIKSLGIGSNTIIKIKSYYANLYFNSSIFDNNSLLDLSMSFMNTNKKSVINVKSDVSFIDEVTVELTSCTMRAKQLANAHLYKDGVDQGKVKVNENGYPEFAITKGGKYTIE